MGNNETVQEIYAAFGRGDVPTMLGHLADDVEWEDWPESWSPYAADVPWLRRLRGGPAARVAAAIARPGCRPPGAAP